MSKINIHELDTCVGKTGFTGLVHQTDRHCFWSLGIIIRQDILAWTTTSLDIT